MWVYRYILMCILFLRRRIELPATVIYVYMCECIDTYSCVFFFYTDASSFPQRSSNVSLVTLMLVCIPLGMAVSQPQKFPYRSQYIKVTIGPRTHQKCPLTGLHSTWNGADVFIMRLHVFDQGCCSQKCVVGLFCLYNRSLLPFIIGLI